MTFGGYSAGTTPVRSARLFSSVVQVSLAGVRGTRDSLVDISGTINYKSQLIIVTDSDNCFPRKIQGLNLSSSPFQFKNSLYNFSLFSCKPDTESSYQVPCLNSASTSVLVFTSDDDIDDLPILSCTKMYTVLSVPYDIWSYSSLELTWSGPKCGHCEGKGKICRFENNSTDLKTECFDPDKDRGIVLFLPNFHFYNHTSSVS